jgi:hypothetical protein
MDSITKGFTIAACSVVIGWAGISVYSHYEKERRAYALNECTKNEEYKQRMDYVNRLSRHGLVASAFTARQGADLLLNKCLSKYNLSLKEE